MSARVIATFALVLLAALAARQKPSEDEKKRAEVARLQALLDEALPDVNGLDEPLPLSKYLKLVEGRLPRAKNLSLSLDKEGLGKDFDKLAETKVSVPGKLNKVSLRTLLHRVLKQIPGEVDYAVRPSGIVITRTRLAAHSVSYPVGDLIDGLPTLKLRFKGRALGSLKGVKPTDGEAVLTRLLTNGVELQEFESLEVQNGVRLVTVALSRNHAEIESLLALLRGMADLAVVVNARIYEIDKATYAKHVGPLFTEDKDGKRPGVVLIDQAAFKAVTKGKLIQKSEDHRLRQKERTLFLSKQTVFRYSGGPDPEDAKRKVILSGLSGVSFRVRPGVSADRRFVTLEISQQVAQLVSIDKTHKLDVSSGKRVEVESPNLRRSSRSGTVKLPDAGALLMPVDYQPAGKQNEGKVWVLVARPFIWIEEEEAERRDAGRETSSQDVWDSVVSKEDE